MCSLATLLKSVGLIQSPPIVLQSRFSKLLLTPRAYHASFIDMNYCFEFLFVGSGYICTQPASGVGIPGLRTSSLEYMTILLIEYVPSSSLLACFILTSSFRVPAARTTHLPPTSVTPCTTLSLSNLIHLRYPLLELIILALLIAVSLILSSPILSANHFFLCLAAWSFSFVLFQSLRIS